MDRAVAAQDLPAVVVPLAVGRRLLVGPDHLAVRRDPVLAHHGEVARELVEHALGGCCDEAPGVAVETGDLLALDERRRIVVGGDRRAADLRCPLAAQLRHHVAVLVPDLPAEIAGIARAGPVPRRLGVEHQRLPAPACERERGGKPDVPRPHDHRLGLARRRGPRRLRPRRQVPPIRRGLEIGRQHVVRHRTLQASVRDTVPRPEYVKLGGNHQGRNERPHAYPLPDQTRSASRRTDNAIYNSAWSEPLRRLSNLYSLIAEPNYTS